MRFLGTIVGITDSGLARQVNVRFFPPLRLAQQDLRRSGAVDFHIGQEARHLHRRRVRVPGIHGAPSGGL